jgi:anhydro-N-acetylmuramic acid kinase
VPERYIGLMSGTSMDGVDGVILECTGDKNHVLAHATCAFDVAFAKQLLSLNTSGDNELHRSALAANALVNLYASLVAELLAKTSFGPNDIRAIGAHGQTVRHRPQAFDGIGYTLQLNNPALLAERCGITVVADFRSRDVAAGGQGAPLVPAFHQTQFAQAGQTVAVLNLGGIANLSVLRDDEVLGFDCGPGNVLLDLWSLRQRGLPFDAQGLWAASGKVVAALLDAFLTDPFFALAPPKSTGRDLFHEAWLNHHLQPFAALLPQDVQATLTELTAWVCSRSVLQFAPQSHVLIVCGGGAFNQQLMARLQAHLPNQRVSSSADYGVAPLQVEAAAFAWLAKKTLAGETGSLKSVTGAKGARVLGAIYPA